MTQSICLLVSQPDHPPHAQGVTTKVEQTSQSLRQPSPHHPILSILPQHALQQNAALTINNIMPPPDTHWTLNNLVQKGLHAEAHTPAPSKLVTVSESLFNPVWSSGCPHSGSASPTMSAWRLGHQDHAWQILWF
jgi:hypothetical protein